jgi:hypothetical protein
MTNINQFINNRQGNNVSVQSWYDTDVNWTPAIVNQLQQFVRYSPQTVDCEIALPGQNLVHMSLLKSTYSYSHQIWATI